MPQQNMTSPNSGGRPQPSNGGGKPPAPFSGGGAGAQTMGGGQIKISQAEETALIALETGDSPEEAMERAVEDSGLDEEQVMALQTRAEAARKKGYTLVGMRVTLKPLAPGEEPNALAGEKFTADKATLATDTKVPAKSKIR